MANNTIEKALQRQKEAAAKRAAEQAESQEESKSSTIERTVEKQQISASEPQNEKPVKSKVVEKRKAGAAVNADNEALNLTINLEELDERGFVSVSNARKLINEEYRET